MKKNLLKITFASLLALSLGACSCSGNGGNSGGSTSSNTSTPVHEHTPDEHGVCTVCGAYRGETKTATKEDPYVLENIVAGNNYYFRLQASKDIQTILTCNIDPKADMTKTKIWETNGTTWNEIPPNSKTHIISNISDGYYYVRYVSKENLTVLQWWVENHVHQVNEQGICWCGEYTGSDIRLNEDFTIGSTVANQIYYARVKNLNPAEKYKLQYDATVVDSGRVFDAWGTDNGTSFATVNLFNPTGAINYKEVYLAFKPSIAGYRITFTLKLVHNVNECGYCVACGAFVGTELANSELIKEPFTMLEGTYYYRIPDISKDDLVMFTTGWGLSSSDEVTFYSRSADGKTITELPYRPEVAFLAPTLPDEYLYVQVHTYGNRYIPFMGLNDMNAGNGQNEDIFTGVTMNQGDNGIVDLGTNEALFFKFGVHEEHRYELTDISDFVTADFTWFGHDKENNDFVEKGHILNIELDEYCKIDGVEYDYFIIRLMPTTADHSETTISFNVEHRFDIMQVCPDDGYFGGIEVSFDQSVIYNVTHGNVGYYRFPIREDARYTFECSGSISDFEFLKYESGYKYVAWAGEESALESEDGYIYIKIDASSSDLAGEFTVSEIID